MHDLGVRRCGTTTGVSHHIVVLPSTFLDRVNRVLKHTTLRHFGLFMVVVARKE